MVIDITGYITEADGDNLFTIKVTSDNIPALSLSDIQVSKEVKVFIKPHYYPLGYDSEFRPVGRDENLDNQIDKYISLSEALSKGDRVKCSVCIVETKISNGQETHIINSNPNDLETYTKFPLWLYPTKDAFERLKVDSRESLRFRKQWFYTLKNSEKCEKINSKTWYTYVNKWWINKNPKLIFLMLWGVRFRTAATKLWEYYKDPKNTTITRIIATISPLIAFASLILNIWLFFFRKP